MIETDIPDALGPLFGSRVYPDTAPMGAVMPYCIYQRAGGVPSNTFCGNTNKQNARIQIMVWSKRREDSNRLALLAETILTQPPYRGVSQGSFVARYDEPTKNYGTMQDFSFWFS